jgi:uncharacterized membrane protein YdbT with pleckstrin-like domain
LAEVPIQEAAERKQKQDEQIRQAEAARARSQRLDEEARQRAAQRAKEDKRNARNVLLRATVGGVVVLYVIAVALTEFGVLPRNFSNSTPYQSLQPSQPLPATGIRMLTPGKAFVNRPLAKVTYGGWR